VSRKLDQARQAHRVVCDLLKNPSLSLQAERQISNLKRLLELEISALESEEDDDGGNGLAAD